MPRGCKNAAHQSGSILSRSGRCHRRGHIDRDLPIEFSKDDGHRARSPATTGARSWQAMNAPQHVHTQQHALALAVLRLCTGVAPACVAAMRACPACNVFPFLCRTDEVARRRHPDQDFNVRVRSTIIVDNEPLTCKGAAGFVGMNCKRLALVVQGTDLLAHNICSPHPAQRSI